MNKCCVRDQLEQFKKSMPYGNFTNTDYEAEAPRRVAPVVSAPRPARAFVPQPSSNWLLEEEEAQRKAKVQADL